jgi:NAD(P)H dehydrogenase (quinone)
MPDYQPLIRIAVVYHSGFGHTARQADAVARGARTIPGTRVDLLTVEPAPHADTPSGEAFWRALDRADAIIFGAPTYMGSASAPFAAFKDATAKPWSAQRWNGKVAAGFTNSGAQHGDKLVTLVQLAILAMQHGMIWVGLDLPPGHDTSKGSAEDLNRLGAWLGAMAQSNKDQGPELVPPTSDLLTAEHLGRRVAEITAQLRRGRTIDQRAPGAEMVAP